MLPLADIQGLEKTWKYLEGLGMTWNDLKGHQKDLKGLGRTWNDLSVGSVTDISTNFPPNIKKINVWKNFRVMTA